MLLTLPLAGQSLREPLQVYSEFARFQATGEVAAPAQPREILSPALVRNGFTSFQIAVRVEPGSAYSLVVGQNPEDAVKVTVFREAGDKLEPVTLPYSGDRTQIFWMDVWTDGAAPVRRVKVEPQLYVNRDWVVYPMEARVMEARVPDVRSTDGICPAVSGAEGDVARLQLRNALQDAALATLTSKEEAARLAGGCSKSEENPEAYLAIRDYLFRMR